MAKSVQLKKDIETDTKKIPKGIVGRVVTNIVDDNNFLLGYVIAIPFTSHVIKLIVRTDEVKEL